MTDYDSGRFAYYCGLDATENPYEIDTWEFSCWREGWNDAFYADKGI